MTAIPRPRPRGPLPGETGTSPTSTVDENDRSTHYPIGGSPPIHSPYGYYYGSRKTSAEAGKESGCASEPSVTTSPTCSPGPTGRWAPDRLCRYSRGCLCEAVGSTLRVTGTDLEMTVRTSTEVEVREEGGWSSRPSWRRRRSARCLPGAITLGMSDGEVEITGNGPRFSLRQMAVDDFPTVGDEVAGSGLSVDGDAIAAAIAQVAVAASSDAARPLLTGVLFEAGEDGGTTVGGNRLLPIGGS